MLFRSKTIQEELLGALPEKMEEAERLRRINEISWQMDFENLEQTIQNLSGGWRKRVSILKALIQKPDLLLMDEPTNHLDMEGILWLERLLENASFAFVLVSHDRFFLENRARRIIELNKQYPEGYLKVEGSYSQFLQKKEEFLHAQAQKEEVLSKDRKSVV